MSDIPRPLLGQRYIAPNGTLTTTGWRLFDALWQVSRDGRFATDIGDGVSTTLTVTHNLGTLDVLVEVFEKATGDTVGTTVRRVNANTVQIITGAPLALNSHRVVVRR